MKLHIEYNSGYVLDTPVEYFEVSEGKIHFMPAKQVSPVFRKPVTVSFDVINRFTWEV